MVSLRDAAEEANCQLASHWLKCVYHMAQQKSLSEETVLTPQEDERAILQEGSKDLGISNPLIISYLIEAL